MNRTQFCDSHAGKALIEYQTKYRHPAQPEFEVGDVVHLFPNEQLASGTAGISLWTSRWPHDESAGVYLIYSEAQELLYIGKCSMGQVLGRRLYCHFGGGDECVVKGNGWVVQPSFVVNVAVPADSPWEAPALEEFLIGKCRPILNVHGI